MINRLISIVKHAVFGFFKFLLYILRCGRRKRVQVDDSMPTDIVIQNSSNDIGKTQPYPQSSSMSNGYEMQVPYYNQGAMKHPGHDQSNANANPGLDEEDTNDSQLWDEWENEATNFSSHQSLEQQDLKQDLKEPPTEEEVDFFADMEPTVKVKKIFVKKKQKEIPNNNSAKFSINQDLDFKTKTDLEDWVDDDDDIEGGWEDDDIGIEVDPSKVAKEAREMRKKERILRSEEQKHQHNKELGNRNKKTKLGTKVS